MFESFAFKRGVPLDADYVFDVRMLPNPHYVPALRPLTGRDAPVIEWLREHDDVARMYDDIEQFLPRWLDALARDHRSYVTVAIGCTGGQHRSVFLVEQLARGFGARWAALKRHRELDASLRPSARLRSRLASSLRTGAGRPSAGHSVGVEPAPCRRPAASRPARDRTGCRCRSLCVSTCTKAGAVVRVALRRRRQGCQQRRRGCRTPAGNRARPRCPRAGRFSSHTRPCASRASSIQSDCALRRSLRVLTG